MRSKSGGAICTDTTIWLYQWFCQPDEERATLRRDIHDLLASLSPADTIGQLFMLGFDGADPAAALPALSELRAGGIVLTHNVADASSAARLTRALQQAAAACQLPPLLISVNHEAGHVQPIRGGMTDFG